MSPIRPWVLLGALLVSLQVAADKPAPLTVQKIRHIAGNCGSQEGFTSRLEAKEGVRDVHVSRILLTSLPAQSDVRFTLHGKAHTMRVAPQLDFSRLEQVYLKQSGGQPFAAPADEDAQRKARIRREVQVLDLMLRDYEAQARLPKRPE